MVSAWLPLGLFALFSCPFAHAETRAEPEGCDVSVVGAGWAGVYFAYRLSESGAANSSSICIFEKSGRVGGRTYSVEVVPGGDIGNEFVAEMGAYRFSPDMHLPGDLILNDLSILTECWDPGCPDAKEALNLPGFNYHAPLRKIVDLYGENLGYKHPIAQMLVRLTLKGARLHLGHELVGIAVDGNTNVTTLSLSYPTADGKTSDILKVSSGTVMLNLPRVAMNNVASVRSLMTPRVFSTFNCTAFDMPDQFKHLNPGNTLMKAYAYYDDAWWLSKLGLIDGSFPKEEFVPVITKQGVPLSLHYNDGPVRCAMGRDSTGKTIWSGKLVAFGRCKGLLQTFYSFMNTTWYDRFQKDVNEPLVTLRPSDSPEAAGALSDLHESLMETHADLFKKMNASTKDIGPPTLLVMGVWRRDAQGMTAPTKVYYKETVEKACQVDGLDDREYARSLLQPFKQLTDTVFMANNDYRATQTDGMYGDWAEESLLMSERALRLLGLPKPAWLNATYYQSEVVAKA